MKPEKPGPGQESVWDYPRPPRLEASSRVLKVVLAGQELAASSKAFRVLETSHPPSWYIPREDVRMDYLSLSFSGGGSVCEWKGRATYWHVRVPGSTVENAVWSYEMPAKAFAPIAGYLAFYPGHFECFVDGERVVAQPGGFYGGWITKDVAGPFKGVAGSWGW